MLGASRILKWIESKRYTILGVRVDWKSQRNCLRMRGVDEVLVCLPKLVNVSDEEAPCGKCIEAEQHELCEGD